MNYISCIKNHQKDFGFHQKISSSLQTCHQIGIKTFYLHIFQIKDSESVKIFSAKIIMNHHFVNRIIKSQWTFSILLYCCMHVRYNSPSKIILKKDNLFEKLATWSTKLYFAGENGPNFALSILLNSRDFWAKKV